MQRLSGFTPRGTSLGRSARVVEAFLFLGAVAAVTALLGFSTTAVPVPPRWRGALIGIATGLFGIFLFGLGYRRGTRHEGLRMSSGGDQKQSDPTPDEAKFWLKKFLEEQQKK